MKAVIQRVTEASVTIDGQVVGEIGHGILLLLGVCPQDGEKEAAWLADKVVNLVPEVIDKITGIVQKSKEEKGAVREEPPITL